MMRAQGEQQTWQAWRILVSAICILNFTYSKLYIYRWLYATWIIYMNKRMKFLMYDFNVLYLSKEFSSWYMKDVKVRQCSAWFLSSPNALFVLMMPFHRWKSPMFSNKCHAIIEKTNGRWQNTVPGKSPFLSGAPLWRNMCNQCFFFQFPDVARVASISRQILT